MAVVCIRTNFTVMTVLVLTDFTKLVFHRYKQKEKKKEKKELISKRLIQLKHFSHVSNVLFMRSVNPVILGFNTEESEQ